MNAPRAAWRRLCVTDRKLAGTAELPAACRRAVVERGATAILVREPDLAPAEYEALWRAVRSATPREVPVLVARDPEAALRLGADGVQLASTGESVAAVRARVGPRFVVGRSTHERAEVVAAAAEGADYVVFGPVLATPSKAGIFAPRGYEGLAAAARAVAIPVVGIGGLGPAEEIAVRAAGAAGFAAIRFFMSSERPSS